jgi:hypothetical protein
VAGAPFPLLPPLHPVHAIERENRHTNANPQSIRRVRRRPTLAPPKITSPGKPAKASHIASLFPAGEKPPGRAKRAEVPLSTVTVTMVGEEPLSVTGPGR